MREADLVEVQVDLGERVVRAHGALKSSIDSAVHAWLYRELPIVGLVHMHDAIVLPDAETEFPYPCGTLEEAEEIQAALSVAASRGLDLSRGFAVELIDHGHLIGLPAGALERLVEAWDEARRAYDGHLAELQASPPPAIRPLWDGAEIVGVVGCGRDWVAPFVLEAGRKRGVGDRLADWLRQRGRRVAVHDGCGVEGFYLCRGFREVGREGPLTVFTPPNASTPARVGASVCLVDVVGRRVLMGRRLVEPWAGRTSFPGGGVEAGEGHLEAARRELEEETALLAPARPWFERVVYAGDAQQVLCVHCFVIPCLKVKQPQLSDEFAGEWLSFAEARARKLTPSAGRILDDAEAACGSRG